MGWPPEDMAAQDLQCEDHFVCCTSKETDVSCQSLGFSSRPLEREIVDQDELHYYTLIAMDSSSSTKKLCHNAYERGRRKKINDLYASLRALLPESDQSRKKNLSIPLTISRVLKYIPELQRQVERLQQRKEEILLALSRPEEQSHCGDIVVYRPMVSAACLSNREVMVQVCLLSSHFSISFSKILRLLKREELHLVNASTYTTHDGRCFCSLHIEARETFDTECRIFCDTLLKEIKEQAELGSRITWNM
ncbi:protein IRON-RELATED TRANSCRIPTION FACTOR 2-like [Musa acuminata AAA Group]|uniref:protein IRON-RELATED TRANSCRIPTION FACTOR 2-like n=1 Tax=Musa acuminata AAA Group TaxID=214697 RepID=UPI0031D39B5B